MFDNITKSPTTTIAGILLGLATYFQATPDLHGVTLTGGLTAIGVALLGLFTKVK